MLEDNASAIKLSTTPLIPSKSRHIVLKEHHVRWAFKSIQILPQHQSSCDIVPDAATKYVGPSRFLYFRNQIFQPPPQTTPSNPVVPHHLSSCNLTDLTVLTSKTHFAA
jgi:hypothetical protein